MSKKNELVISGLSLLSASAEVAELEALMGDETTEVFHMKTKSAISDMVQLVFNDFHPATLVMEYAITKVLLDTFYDKVKPALLHLLRKGITVKNVCIQKDFISDNQIPYSIYIVADSDKIEGLIQRVDTFPKVLLEPTKPGCTIVIRYDEDGKLDIHTMGE